MAEESVAEAAQRAGLCADMLALGGRLGLWSCGLALLALAVLLFAPAAPAALLWATFALAVPAAYFALRVRFDEAVFRRWADAWRGSADDGLPVATMAAFDRALGRTADGRPLAARCRGAGRLLRWQAAVTALQTACAVAAALYIR